MYIQRNNAEKRLVDLVKAIKGDIEQHYALHFHLSQLNPEYRSEFQMRIAMNVLNDLFRNERGAIFQTRDGDIFVVYHGSNRQMLEQAVYQVRYLFHDDPLSVTPDGKDGADFCITYDLALQWRHFYRECMERHELMISRIDQGDDATEILANDVITPTELGKIIPKLEQIEFDYVIRKQPICAIAGAGKIKPVYNELFINMSHLKKLLDVDYELPSNPWLFQYLVTRIDGYMIKLLRDRPHAHLTEPLSLNLTIETTLSDDFREFCELVNQMKKPITLVIELHVSDVFTNMTQLDDVRKFAKKHNCRLCLDGLTTESFVELNRQSMGFDLMKMQWNADVRGDLGEVRNQRLKDAVKSCGAARIILCRCDTEHAIEYGKELGITLFQGRYTDKLLNPDTTVIN